MNRLAEILAIPGCPPDKIKISITDGSLIINLVDLNADDSENIQEEIKDRAIALIILIQKIQEQSTHEHNSRNSGELDDIIRGIIDENLRLLELEPYFNISPSFISLSKDIATKGLDSSTFIQDLSSVVAVLAESISNYIKVEVKQSPTPENEAIAAAGSEPTSQDETKATAQVETKPAVQDETNPETQDKPTISQKYFGDNDQPSGLFQEYLQQRHANYWLLDFAESFVSMIINSISSLCGAHKPYYVSQQHARTDYINELAQQHSSADTPDNKAFKDSLESGLTLFKPRSANSDSSLEYLIRELASEESIELSQPRK